MSERSGPVSTEKIQTYCAMCTSRCGVVATIEDGRFTRVDADPDHPNGCICIKGSAAPEIVYSGRPASPSSPKDAAQRRSQPRMGANFLERCVGADRKTPAGYTGRVRSGESVAYGCATTAGSATDDTSLAGPAVRGIRHAELHRPDMSAHGAGYLARSTPTAFRPRGPIPRTPTAFCCGVSTPRRRTRSAPDGSQRRGSGERN